MCQIEKRKLSEFGQAETLILGIPILGILVAVSAERFLNRLLELRLENLGTSQLADLLCRLADCQVACSGLAMLRLSVGGETESLAGGFVRFLFCHD